MTRKEALQELLAKVEAVETMNYRDPLDLVRAWRSPLEYFNITDLVTQSHDGSLDAAKALHEAVLPGWRFTIWADGEVVYQDDIKGTPVDRKCDPARAWLIAIIKALIAEEHHE